jgi:predicted TIM-barrel fold metal-dependent hydrolase
MNEVPNSAGTSAPRFRAPAGACDCHIHIYDDARFTPARAGVKGVARATTADYRLFQQRIGTSRVVVVQPAVYGTDNAVTLDAVQQLGAANARGIGVVHPTVTDMELLAMKRGGIRGFRFTLHEPRTAVTSAEMIEPIAHRAARLDLHVQLHLRAEQLLEMADLVLRLPGTVVIDHLGRLPLPGHGAFDVVRRLLDSGRGWVKLSGAYLESRSGSPHYADMKPVAQALIAHAPQRCVWGSDWPHPTEPHTKPDDAALFDLLAEWAPSEPLREKILVSNAAELYGFEA